MMELQQHEEVKSTTRYWGYRELTAAELLNVSGGDDGDGGGDGDDGGGDTSDGAGGGDGGFDSGGINGLDGEGFGWGMDTGFSGGTMNAGWTCTETKDDKGGYTRTCTDDGKIDPPSPNNGVPCTTEGTCFA